MDDLIDKNVLILDSIKNDTYNFKNLLKNLIVLSGRTVQN